MSFESIVDAAVALLRRRGRVTYRMLQREFALDDAALADLRDELVLGQRVARDEGGLVLEWTDRGNDVSERRWLTVLFCDLVGSTRLSAQLDPEDLHDVVRRYHDTCTEALQPTGGWIAQYMGDGLMVYFGYPNANEDDAERAVRAGLSLVQAVARLSRELQPRVPSALAVRVGIHTGRVVVGGLGDARNRENLAMGEAPNLAAHIQAHAEPGTVLVSAATWELLPPGFDAEDLGPVVLKDPSRPLHLLRVRGERRTHGAAEAPPAPRLEAADGPFARLCTLWAQVRHGPGRVLLLRGEAGLGKSRLAAELCGLAARDRVPLRMLRCSAFHRHTALHPIASELLAMAGLDPDAPGDDVPRRLAGALQADGIHHPAAERLLPALYGAAPAAGERPAAGALSAEQRMQALQALMADWLAAGARNGPALLLCEDVQWADPSTLAVLRRLAGKLPPGLLLLMTARPEIELAFDPPPPEVIGLDRMAAPFIREIVLGLPGAQALPAATLERIAVLAEGVPLYAEQIARSVLETLHDAPGSDGDGDAGRAGDAPASIEVPASLSASLLARLDRMGSAKAVAQVAALLGPVFSRQLLAAVCGLPPAELSGALAQLERGGILRAADVGAPGRYVFGHALLQAVAADSMLRAARQAAHAHIAEVLQSNFAAATQAEPETLARHFSGAGKPWQAAAQWRRAGEQALARSALVEGLSHLRLGMDELAALPAGAERDALELSLQIPLASALRAVQGVAAQATGQAYERAVALAEQRADGEGLIPALNGLYSYHLVGNRFDAARAPAERLLAEASARGNALFQMIGHRAVGAVALHIGEPKAALAHLERGLAMYDGPTHAPLAPQLGIDHRVMTSNFLALACAVLGEDERAQAVLADSLAWANEIGHAHSVGQALSFRCIVGALHDDWAAMPAEAERTSALARQHGLTLMQIVGEFFTLATQALQGPTAEVAPAVAGMQAALQRWWATGAYNYRPLCQSLLARALARLQRHDEALALLELAQRQMAEAGERWIEAPLWRLRGELLPAGSAAQAEAWAQGRAVARSQGALGLLRRFVAPAPAEIQDAD
ncbi:MAG: AAA family ATPase [Proteobacteria bacterium]|nr:AAA family ATPase [Pseudomonadota bacterium]